MQFRIGYCSVCVCGHRKSFDQIFGFCWQKGQLQLKFITGDKTWVRQYYPETQAQSMAWKHLRSPTIKKFKTSTSSGKLMATRFWDIHEVLLLHFSPPNETVNSAAYQATLKEFKRAVQHKSLQMSDKRLLFLHDNTRTHTAHATVNLLEGRGWEILEHPPYSPDLVPLDFHLFLNMKKYLRAMRFKSRDDVKHEVQIWLCGQDTTLYQQGFEKWISCIDKCLNKEGN